MTILRTPDKDPTDVRFLHPLALLPELVRIFEQIIRDSMLLHISAENLHHENQFGSRQGGNAVSAIHRFFEILDSIDYKYVVVLYIDDLW